jgi:hypothetical protein
MKLSCGAVGTNENENRIKERYFHEKIKAILRRDG